MVINNYRTWAFSIIFCALIGGIMVAFFVNVLLGPMPPSLMPKARLYFIPFSAVLAGMVASKLGSPNDFYKNFSYFYFFVRGVISGAYSIIFGIIFYSLLLCLYLFYKQNTGIEFSTYVNYLYSVFLSSVVFGAPLAAPIGLSLGGVGGLFAAYFIRRKNIGFNG